MSDDDVHTCHAECPCQTGGKPSPDFLPIERSLLPGLFALARLRARQTGHRHPCSEDGCPGAECYRDRIDGCGHPSKSAADPDGGRCPWGPVPCPGEGRP